MTCKYAVLCKYYHHEKAKCRFEQIAIEQCIAFHRFRQHERRKLIKSDYFNTRVKLL
jgi:hypothetical protein